MPRKKKVDITEASLTGPDLVDIMADEPNIDKFFDENPVNLTDEDIWELIGINRRERALYIKNKAE